MTQNVFGGTLSLAQSINSAGDLKSHSFVLKPASYAWQ